VNLDSAPTTGIDTANQLVDVDSIVPDQTLLADVQRTRITTPLTRLLLALVVLGGAFLAGALVERTQHKTSSSGGSGLDALAAQFRNRLGGQGASGASGASGGLGGGNGSTVGTVKLVDGKNVYIQDFSGNVVKVTTSASTEVDVTSKGTVSDLRPGTSVIVQGTASNDGTSTAATSISQSSGLGNGAPFGGAGTAAGPGTGSG
jgi:hypothetical protein